MATGHPMQTAYVRRKRPASIAPYIVCSVVAIAASLWLSWWLHKNYVYGDVFHYDSFWYSLPTTALSDVANRQAFVTGSTEPLYGHLIYFASFIMERETFVVLTGAGLCIGLYIVLAKYRFPILLMPLVFTNYYLIVLLGPAERLKLSFLALIPFLLIKSVWRYAFLLMSPLFHFQNILVLVSYAARAATRWAVGSGTHWGWRIIGLLWALAGAALILYFRESIGEKLQHYSQEDRTIVDAVSTLAFMAVAVRLSSRKLEVFALFLPIIIASVVVGVSRINMIAFLAFFAIAVEEKRFWDPFFLLALLYASAKSWSFIRNIAQYGTGFIQS